jgi:hypothetical protein
MHPRRKKMDGMFLEMSQMLSTEVTQSSRSTASRALDHFSALFGDSQGFQGGNASTLMPLLFQETENLHSVISLASSADCGQIAWFKSQMRGEREKERERERERAVKQITTSCDLEDARSSDRPSSAAQVASRSASLLGEMQKT